MANNGFLKTLFVSNGIFIFAVSLLGPLYAVYVQKLGDGILTISVTSAIALISSTLFTILITRIRDKKIRNEYLLLAGFLLRAIIWVCFIFVQTIPALIILQIFLGLGDAIGTPAFNSFFADHLDRDKHLQEYADWQILNNIAIAASILLGGVIVTIFGFTTLFLCMALLALMASLALIHRIVIAEQIA